MIMEVIEDGTKNCTQRQYFVYDKTMFITMSCFTNTSLCQNDKPDAFIQSHQKKLQSVQLAPYSTKPLVNAALKQYIIWNELVPEY